MTTTRTKLPHFQHTNRLQAISKIHDNKQTRQNKTIQNKIRRGYNSEKTGDHQNLSKSPSSHLPISSKHHHPLEENAKNSRNPQLKKLKRKNPKHPQLQAQQ
jgi:hypothetical protein